jgi:hypothetical protein
MVREGYDDKYVQALLSAKPTTNRADAVQWWGRGARLWSGIGEIDEMEQRRAAIAASPKPECLVIELNAKCEHELANPVTIFGQAFTEAEQKTAKNELAKKGGGDPLKALQDAREELAAREARKKAAGLARVQLREERDRERLANERRTSAGDLALTPGQERRMNDFGIPFDENTTKAKASELLRKEFFAQSKGWAVYKTRVALEQKVGVHSAWALPLDVCHQLRAAWIANGRQKLKPMQINSIIGRQQMRRAVT